MAHPYDVQTVSFEGNSVEALVWSDGRFGNSQASYVKDGGLATIIFVRGAPRYEVGPNLEIIKGLYDLVGTGASSDAPEVVKSIQLYLWLIVRHWRSTGHHADWLATVEQST